MSILSTFDYSTPGDPAGGLQLPEPFAPDMSLRGLDLLVSHLLHRHATWERFTTAVMDSTLRTSGGAALLLDVERAETMMAISALTSHCGTQALDTIHTLYRAGHRDPVLVTAACRAGLTATEVAEVPASLSAPRTHEQHALREQRLTQWTFLGRLRGITQ